MKVTVTRFSLKYKRALYCAMHYICYSPSKAKIDYRMKFTKNKVTLIFGSQRKKNEKNDTHWLFHFLIFFGPQTSNGSKLVYSLNLLRFPRDIGTPKAL